MVLGRIYLLNALVLSKLALGTPLPVVTITQVSTFIADLPVQTVTSWYSITTFVPKDPQGTETVLSTFSEAFLFRTTPHQTFLITSVYLATLAGQTGSTGSQTTSVASSTAAVSTSPVITTFTTASAGSPSPTIADTTLTAPSQGQGFPQFAVIILSIILALAFVGAIALIWRCRKYRKAHSALQALARTPPPSAVPFPEFKNVQMSSPPGKGRPSQSQSSSNMTSWTGVQRATAAMHPGTPVDLSLHPITRPISNPFRRSLHTPRSSEDYTTEGSSTSMIYGPPRARSGTWGSTTTALHSPTQRLHRFQAVEDALGYQYTPEAALSGNCLESEAVEGGSLGNDRWDEAIRRLDSLHQDLVPPPLNNVKHGKAMLHHTETPVSEIGALASTSNTPLSRISTPDVSIAESSRAPSASESVSDAREQTLAALEGKEIRRKYSPSVYSRHVDGSLIEGRARREAAASVDWTGMFEGGLGGDGHER